MDQMTDPFSRRFVPCFGQGETYRDAKLDRVAFEFTLDDGTAFHLPLQYEADTLRSLFNQMQGARRARSEYMPNGAKAPTGPTSFGLYCITRDWWFPVDRYVIEFGRMVEAGRAYPDFYCDIEIERELAQWMVYDLSRLYGWVPIDLQPHAHPSLSIDPGDRCLLDLLPRDLWSELSRYCYPEIVTFELLNPNPCPTEPRIRLRFENHWETVSIDMDVDCIVDELSQWVDRVRMGDAKRVTIEPKKRSWHDGNLFGLQYSDGMLSFIDDRNAIVTFNDIASRLIVCQIESIVRSAKRSK
jgi:hypothetical protein